MVNLQNMNWSMIFFEPFEQVGQVQAQLLGVTFEILSGGPAQTHVGTGGGSSSSDMPWGGEEE